MTAVEDRGCPLWRPGGSKRSPGRSIAQWSHIPITSKMIWIWIRILVKSWIRIRIGVTTSVADLWHFGVDPDADPDPAIFVIDLQDANKKLIFLTSFSAYYFLKVHLHHFSKIKNQKDVTKQYESRFLLLFLLGDRRIRIHNIKTMLIKKTWKL